MTAEKEVYLVGETEIEGSKWKARIVRCSGSETPFSVSVPKDIASVHLIELGQQLKLAGVDHAEYAQARSAVNDVIKGMEKSETWEDKP